MILLNFLTKENFVNVFSLSSKKKNTYIGLIKSGSTFQYRMCSSDLGSKATATEQLLNKRRSFSFLNNRDIPEYKLEEATQKLIKKKPAVVAVEHQAWRDVMSNTFVFFSWNRWKSCLFNNFSKFEDIDPSRIWFVSSNSRWHTVIAHIKSLFFFCVLIWSLFLIYKVDFISGTASIEYPVIGANADSSKSVFRKETLIVIYDSKVDQEFYFSKIRFFTSNTLLAHFLITLSSMLATFYTSLCYKQFDFKYSTTYNRYINAHHLIKLCWKIVLIVFFCTLLGGFLGEILYQNFSNFLAENFSQFKVIPFIGVTELIINMSPREDYTHIYFDAKTTLREVRQTLILNIESPFFLEFNTIYSYTFRISPEYVRLFFSMIFFMIWLFPRFSKVHSIEIEGKKIYFIVWKTNWLFNFFIVSWIAIPYFYNILL